jgi:hypothetical protein
MSDFLTSLALRGLGSGEIIRPRVPALFESRHPTGSLATVPGIVPPLRDQEPQEEIALESDATLTRKRAANTFFHEPPVGAEEESQPRLPSILRLAHIAEAVPPGSQEQAEEIATKAVPEPPGTGRRAADLGSGKPLDEVLALPSADRRQPTAPKPASDTTAAEARHNLTQTEPDLPFPQAHSPRLAAATRAEEPDFPADHSPPAVRLIAPSRVVPRDVISARATPLVRPDSSEPTIQVTIGRIEVRAMSQPAPPTRERSASLVMPLDEYLRRRSRRGGE